jgi:hypothetical protein
MHKNVPFALAFRVLLCVTACIGNDPRKAVNSDGGAVDTLPNVFLLTFRRRMTLLHLKSGPVSFKGGCVLELVNHCGFREI